MQVKYLFFMPLCFNFHFENTSEKQSNKQEHVKRHKKTVSSLG